MVTATLPKRTVSIKPPELEQYPPPIPVTDQGTLIIHLRLSGIDAVKILADQSDTEVQLLELWTAVRPAVDAALVNHDRTSMRI